MPPFSAQAVSHASSQRSTSMPFIESVPTTEYRIAVNSAPFSLLDPRARRRPIAGPLRILSAALCRYRHNAAERALRGIALGRRNWLFAGSDRCGARAAAMYTLIGTAKLNGVDPQAWPADALGRIAGTPQSRIDELLPRNWTPERQHDLAA